MKMADLVMDNRCYPSARACTTAPRAVVGNDTTRWRISWITADVHRGPERNCDDEQFIRLQLRCRRLNFRCSRRRQLQTELIQPVCAPQRGACVVASITRTSEAA